MSEENSKKQDSKKNRNEYMKEYMKQYRAKNREKLNLQRRIKKRAKSLAKKAEKMLNKNAEIEAEIKKGNINYEIQENEMTYTEYREFWAKFDIKPSFEQYLEDLKENRRQKQTVQRDIYKTESWQILANVPVMRQTKNDCIRFRGMYLNKIDFDTLFIDSHLCTCEACQYWRYENKKVLPLRPNEIKGVDLWNHKEIPVKQTSDQAMINEEMRKLYGTKHNQRIE